MSVNKLNLGNTGAILHFYYQTVFVAANIKNHAAIAAQVGTLTPDNYTMTQAFIVL